MSKKNLILLIITIFILLTVAFFYFYFFNSSNNQDNNTRPTEEFPFGISQNEETDIKYDTKGSLIENLFGSSTSTETEDYTKIKIRQIYKKPISGLVFIEKNLKTFLSFIDRASGNIYDYQINTPTNDPIRTTNTTIPKIQESSFFNNGQSFVLRYIDDSNSIISFLGKISTSSDPNIKEITGEFLSKDIKQIVISPTGNNIFELLEDQKSNTSGYIYSSTTINNKKEIFSSASSFWNISWPKEEIITFTTKPNYREYGFLFFFNTKTYTFERVLGEITGLTTNTNPATDLVLYSENKSNSLKLKVYDTKNLENKNIEINTISDKCIWGNYNKKSVYCAVPNNIPKGNYPDDWYQGSVSFNDSLWYINTEEGTTKMVFENKDENSLNLDMIDLKISPDDKYISFINKNDLSLWLIDLNEK